MAKTIKFNLICNNTSVRSLEDLQENFCVDDILPLYEHGLLQRWLDVRGYQSELQKVKEITSTNKYDIITNLAMILGVEQDRDKIKADLAYYQYMNDKNNDLKKLSEEDNGRKYAIAQYYKGYLDQIKKLISIKDNISETKNIVKIIANDYIYAFSNDYYRVFIICLTNNMIALMCLLMNPVTRCYYIADNNEKKEDNTHDTENGQNKENERPSFFGGFFGYYGDIAQLRNADNKEGENHSNNNSDTVAREDSEHHDANITNDDDNFSQLYSAAYNDVNGTITTKLNYIINNGDGFKNVIKDLGNNLLSYGSTTDQYWKDLEPKEQKIMLIKGEPGTKYRGTNNRGSEKDGLSIAGHFPIIDGLDYMNNYEGRSIYWMEV